MMSDQVNLRKHSAARRAQAMIGQEEAWQQIEAALSPSDRLFHVVLVRAEGGMGKTRILERVLENCGRTVDPLDDHALQIDVQPQELDDPVIGNLIDVINTQLHDRYRFVVALRHSLRSYPDLNFDRFDVAEDKVKQLAASGALLRTLANAQQGAADDFVKDLKAIAKDRRVVLLIDTVERLSYAATDWLLTEGLLESRDMEIRTHQWLRSLIADSELENITLILAGRGREGRDFFDRMEATADDPDLAGRRCRLTDIHLKRLSMNQTRLFLAQLAEDYAAAGQEYKNTAESFRIAADPTQDRYKVIALFTNGVPVRLALYAQVIAEGKIIPAMFKMSYREACDRAELLPGQLDEDSELPEVSPPRLRQIQWQIEEEFINLLFSAPTDRRAAVLRALVRAPRGLTAEQLWVALDAPEGQDPKSWLLDIPITSAKEQLQELLDLLRELADDYIIKRRSSWDELSLALNELLPGASTLRIGLQDEIYRIYSEHMGLFAEPVSESTSLIREGATEHEKERYLQSWRDEQTTRQALYAKLAAFADYQLALYTEKKKEILLKDEADFEQAFRLDVSNTYRFPDLTDDVIDDRRALLTALTVFGIERMIYRLLLDPERNLNADYLALTPEPDNQKAASQDEDFWAQAELWWALNDSSLMKFVKLHERRLASDRGESSLDVLRRVAEQENVTRWIKRFLVRGQYDRAINFGEKVETVIHSWPQGDSLSDEGREQQNKWNSWNHTLAREERNIWVQQAIVRQGKQVNDAITNISQSVKNLTKLFVTSVNKPAFRHDNRVERGFAAAPITTKSSRQAADEHPAYNRLRRLLSFAHNSLGFSYRTLGEMGKAAEHYRIALEFIRVDSDAMKPHRARVINNLARVLSELGWNSVGICLDGHDIRRDLAEEVPLASSYNTLALIYDDMGRYEDAPLLSAKAIAYCRRANEQRQLALSLRQMAESLRHIAERVRTGQRAAGSADIFFNNAETLLREARSIFSELDEAERLIEVNLEKGSLLRDRMQSEPGKERPRSWKRHYEDATYLLSSVERAARQRNMGQHVLDALINQVRIHYYAGELETAVRTIESIEKDKAYGEHIIRPTHMPDAEKPTLRNRNWIFRHLATAQMIRGWMASDRFNERVAFLKAQNEDATWEERKVQVAGDEIAQGALAEMAQAYVLGIAYAELYSPRSRSIGGMQNDLYGRLKKFNRTELNSFRNQLQIVKKQYPNVQSLKLVDNFLWDFFGGAELTVIGVRRRE